MKKTVVRFLAAFLAAAAFLVAGATESQAYFGLKGGMFVPNDKSDGLDGFDNGATGELFFGFAVGPADLEFGLGAYTCQPEHGDNPTVGAGYATATVKAHLPVGPLSLYAGGGLGGYAGVITYDSALDEDNENGFGVGFHAVGGAELSLGLLSLLAELKWFAVEVDFDPGKMQMGGLMANVGILF